MKHYKTISLSVSKNEDGYGMIYGINIETVSTQDLDFPYNVEHHHIQREITTIYELEEILETDISGWDKIKIESDDYTDDIVEILEDLVSISIENRYNDEQKIKSIISEIEKMREAI